MKRQLDIALGFPSGNSNMTKEDSINFLIRDNKVNAKLVSDGYHTFGELYEHRITLYIALCKVLSQTSDAPVVWRSRLHSDETMFEGSFILGIAGGKGHQITYHLPLSKWEDTEFAIGLDRAPEYDGHTSEDVLKRLKEL